MFIVFSGWATLGAGSAIPAMMEEFNRDLNSVVNAVVTWAVLLLGVGVVVSIVNADCVTDFFLGSRYVVLGDPSYRSRRYRDCFCLLYLGRGNP